MKPETSAKIRVRPWDWWLALAGAGLATLDFALFAALGIDMSVMGRDVTAGLFAWFAVSFAAFGFVIGRLLQARVRARADARTIEAQMDAFAASQQALVEAETLAALGRLAAGVAHEVRNPLGVIRASASMVQENFAPAEEPHRACEFIKEEIDRLNGLIDSLLRFARPTHLQRRAVQIEKVIDRALHLSSELLAKHQVRIERDSDAVPVVEADPDLLVQVLVNLLTNAAQAAGPGGCVRVRTASETGAVRVAVSDSGPGIAPADAARIFEPFFTTKATGTGLGLPIAARIAQAHGGRLELVKGDAASELSGACFRLSLPLVGEIQGAYPASGTR